MRKLTIVTIDDTTKYVVTEKGQKPRVFDTLEAANLYRALARLAFAR